MCSAINVLVASVVIQALPKMKPHREFKALYDYTRQHTDELSFKVGDILRVKHRPAGGWWQGELNGLIGWFPSNYVTEVTQPVDSSSLKAASHLQDCQHEMLQHLVESELQHSAELRQLIEDLKSFSKHQLTHQFLHKLPDFLELLNHSVQLHDWLARSLKEMMSLQTSSYCIGKRFLEAAPIVDSIVCEYAKLYTFLVAGVQKQPVSSLSSLGFIKLKQQLMLVFDRLDRYPIILKETERYLEETHTDRSSVLTAMQVYTELSQRCCLLRKLKEADVEILSAEILGWQGQPLTQLGDPAITVRVTWCLRNSDGKLLPRSTQSSAVLVVFHACLLLLLATESSSIFKFMYQVSLAEVNIHPLQEPDTGFSVTFGAMKDALLFVCSDRGSRDLLIATIASLLRGAPRRITHESIADVKEEGQQPNPLSGSHLGPPGESTERQVSSVETATEPPSHANRESETKAIAEEVSAPQAVPSRLPFLSLASKSLPALPVHHSTVGEGEEQEDSQIPCCLTSKMAVADIRELRGCKLLDHTSRLQPHVLWPDDVLAYHNRLLEPPSQVSDRLLTGFGGAKPVERQTGNVISSLRLDSTPWVDKIGLMPSAKTNRTSQGQQYSRPGSPKSGVGILSSGSRGYRRKRSDRQKSAINVDDLLRSAGRLHEMNLRTESDASILNVVESYCGKLSERTSSITNNGNQGIRSQRLRSLHTYENTAETFNASSR